MERTDEVLSFIVANPWLYAESEKINARRAVLTRHTSLFYKVENQNIVLLAFEDNRQGPATK